VLALLFEKQNYWRKNGPEISASTNQLKNQMKEFFVSQHNGLINLISNPLYKLQN